MRNVADCAAAPRNCSMDGKPLRLAVDTNLLLDLADRDEDVLDAVAVIEQRLAQTEWLVSPAVLDELTFLTDSGDTLEVRESATLSFQQLQGAGRFRPLLDIPFPASQVEEVANAIRGRELVPVQELHDSRILAEAAFLECAILLTSDNHLRGVDHEL